MTPTKRREIDSLAETILEGLELQVPFNIETAVARLGGIFEQRQMTKNQPEAFIKKVGERFCIVLNINHQEARKRFSVAHELGHLFLHMGYLTDPDTWQNAKEYQDSVFYRYGYGVEEAEANEFAAAFLMPKDEFCRVVEEKTANGQCLIEAVAAHFNTSKEATLNRGRLLGMFRSE